MRFLKWEISGQKNLLSLSNEYDALLLNSHLRDSNMQKPLETSNTESEIASRHLFAKETFTCIAIFYLMSLLVSIPVFFTAGPAMETLFVVVFLPFTFLVAVSKTCILKLQCLFDLDIQQLFTMQQPPIGDQSIFPYGFHFLFAIFAIVMLGILLRTISKNMVVSSVVAAVAGITNGALCWATCVVMFPIMV